jgi:hypothetical protein
MRTDDLVVANANTLAFEAPLAAPLGATVLTSETT